MEKFDSSELVNIEVERRYKFYKEERIGEYRSFLDDNSSFKFIDLENTKTSEFSSWSDEEPLPKEHRIIESNIFYKIKKPKQINHISFMNTLGGSLKLNDIEVYYLGEKIDYELIFDNSDENFNIYSLGTLTLDLKNYYDLQKITIKVKSINFNNIDEIIVLASVPSENNLYEINYFSYNLKNTNNENVVIDAYDWIRGNTKYDDEIIMDYKPDEPLSIISEVKLYRYKDPLFYFYNIENKYIDGYFKSYLNLIKDETNYQDYYRYQTREKFEVEKEIIITSYEQKLSDYVNSTVEYEIITNLDINNNGIYLVEYKTPFLSVKKEVNVNIKENELNDMKEKYNQLNKELDSLKNKYDEIKSELADIKDSHNNLNDNFKDINNKLNLELGNMNSKYNALINEFNSIKDNYNNFNNVINSNQNKLRFEIDSLKDNYEFLEQKYQLILNNKESDDDCKLKLEETLMKLDDSYKKLKLSEQANEYLEQNILKVDNEESLSIGKGNLLLLILALLILFILLIIFLKKLSAKN